MPALDGINSVVGEVFSEYGEPAAYQRNNGETVRVSVIRFDPFQRQDLAGEGIATTDPSVWVMLSEIPQPLRGDRITPDGEDMAVIRDVEMHARRGYARLHLSN